MALPWQWILDKLARQPDVSIETLREIAVYVPNVGVVPSLSKSLALRQLHEMLAVEDILDPDGAQELVLALVSPDEDATKLSQMIGDADSRAELFRFVQRKKACLEIPVLDKIANDYTTGFYPPVATNLRSLKEKQREQQSAMPFVNEGHEQDDGLPPSPPRPRRLSVQSDDTTVVVDGSPDVAVKPGSRKKSTVECSDEDEKSSKSPATAAAAGTGPPGDGPTIVHSDNEKVTEDDTGRLPRTPPQPATEEKSQEQARENVRRRKSKKVMLMEDDELFVPEDKSKPKPMAGIHSVEVISLDSDDEHDDPRVVKEKEQEVERCCKCKQPGQLFRCEDCPIALHPQCMARERARESEGWLCPGCKYKKAKEKLAAVQNELEQAKEELESFGQVIASPIKQRRGPIEDVVRVKVEESSSLNGEDHLRKKKRSNSSSGGGGGGGSDEDCNVEDNDDWERSKRPRKSKGRSIPHLRRQKIAWSLEEEEALRDGIKKHGFRWATILSHGMKIFHPSRTGQDLKDKWRNMKKKEE